MIEIACVTIENGTIADTWSSLVNPQRPVPASTREIHGIDDAMLACAPEPSAVVPLFRTLCADLPLVIHNAAFDLAFLRPLLRQTGAAPLYNPVIDTLGLARGLFGPGVNALGQLRESLDLMMEPEHRAGGDARTAARTLLAITPRWQRERGVRSVEELAAASQDVMRIGTRRGAGPDLAEDVVSSGRFPAF